jgi:hypothetical protein
LRAELYSRIWIRTSNFTHTLSLSLCLGCCWPSPAESFSGLSPSGLVSKLYYLNT